MPTEKESGIRNTGTSISLRKKHPCGGDSFKVVQMGPEVVLKCEKCGSIVRLERNKFDRALK